MVRKLPLLASLPIAPRIGIETVALIVVEGSIEGFKPSA